MGFKLNTPDSIEASAYARNSSARDVLDDIERETVDVLFDGRPHTFSGDVYQVYKVTITIEAV